MKRFNMTGTSAYHSVPQRTTNFLVTPFNRVVKALSTLTLFIMLMTLTSLSSNAQCSGPNNHCPPEGCNVGQQICVENLTDCEMDINLTNGHCHSSQTVAIQPHQSKACFSYQCIQCDDGCYCANSIDIYWPSTLVTIPGQAWPAGQYDFPNVNIAPLQYCSTCPKGIRIVVSYPNPNETLYSVQCLP